MVHLQKTVKTKVAAAFIASRVLEVKKLTFPFTDHINLCLYTMVPGVAIVNVGFPKQKQN